MLREEDVREDVGSCVDNVTGIGGTFLRIVHLPTGINRVKGPLLGESAYHVRQRFLKEIEEELIAKGLNSHLVPEYGTKPKLRNRKT
jgi:hypothetical protein